MQVIILKRSFYGRKLCPIFETFNVAVLAKSLVTMVVRIS
jgi:hypothetical protein